MGQMSIHNARAAQMGMSPPSAGGMSDMMPSPVSAGGMAQGQYANMNGRSVSGSAYNYGTDYAR